MNENESLAKRNQKKRNWKREWSVFGGGDVGERRNRFRNNFIHKTFLCAFFPNHCLVTGCLIRQICILSH